MIYIVIPVFNRVQFTSECLQSLNKQTYKEFKVIVVDDGSTDGTPEIIKEQFPSTIILKGNGNLWWTGATNIGIEFALKEGQSDDYVLTLNNDLIVNKDYLSNLLDATTLHKDSLIGSVSVDKDNPDVIHDGGVLIKFWTAKFLPINKNKSLHEQLKFNSDLQVSTLPGRGTLIPFKVFEKTGLYNFDKLPHYGADYEFAIRAHNAGFNLFISYKCIVFSHIKSTGLDSEKKYSFKEYFFNMKSPANLKQRINFAFCISKNQLLNTSFLLFDIGRILTHFLKNKFLRGN